MAFQRQQVTTLLRCKHGLMQFIPPEELVGLTLELTHTLER
jgi:hypothetical protein